MNKEAAKKKIGNIVSRTKNVAKKHIGQKAAYFYTHTWNKTMGELTGQYKKHFPKNAERYRRGSMFFKALLREMKVRDVGTIYRGLSKKQALKLISDKKLTRLTFSSFTKDLDTAEEFAMGLNVVLRIKGRVPCIIYDDKRYVSRYNTEKEVLLPPGVFTMVKRTMTANDTQIYDVKFKPTNARIVNVGKGTIKVLTSANNNMNLMWRRKKIHNAEVLLTKLYGERTNINHENMNHAANYNTKKNDPNWKRKNAAIQKMRTRLDAHINATTKRIALLEKGLL